MEVPAAGAVEDVVAVDGVVVVGAAVDVAVGAADVVVGAGEVGAGAVVEVVDVPDGPAGGAVVVDTPEDGGAMDTRPTRPTVRAITSGSARLGRRRRVGAVTNQSPEPWPCP